MRGMQVFINKIDIYGCMVKAEKIYGDLVRGDKYK